MVFVFLGKNLENFNQKCEFLEFVNCSSKYQYKYSKWIGYAYIQLSLNIQLEK